MSFTTIIILNILFYSLAVISQSYDVKSIVPSSKRGYSRSISSSSYLRGESRIARDKNGSFYISTAVRILKVQKSFEYSTVFAGSGNYYSFTAGKGENADIAGVGGMAFDSKGNMFASDGLKSSILKLSPTGEVSLYGGTGDSSISGDSDGPLSVARFRLPTNIAIDEQDNIYVCEGYYTLGGGTYSDGGNRIRKITSKGIVITMAGGKGVGLRDGQGADARFHAPQGLALDKKGNLLIADRDNHAIRIMNSTGYVNTLAGNGQYGFSDGFALSARLNQPHGLTVHQNGDVYIADTGNHAIRKLTIEDNLLITVVGDGQPGFYDGLAKDAQLNWPLSIVFDSENENLHICDERNHAIRGFNLKSAFLSTSLDSIKVGYEDGFGGNARFNAPERLVVDEEKNIYVSDKSNNAIRKITPDGTVSTYSGFGGVSGYRDGDGKDALFSQPGSLVRFQGSLYVMDTLNYRMRVVHPNRSVSTLAGTGMEGFADGYGLEASFSEIKGAALDHSSGLIYFTDTYNQRIRRLNITSKKIETWAGTGTSGYRNGDRLNAQMSDPKGICIDRLGMIYFGDLWNEIRKIDLDGKVSGVAGYSAAGNVDGIGSKARFFFIDDVSCSQNHLYVTDVWNRKIRRVDTDSQQVSSVAGYFLGERGGVNGDAMFNDPKGNTISSSNPNFVYIADTENSMIKELNVLTGRVKVIAGYGGPQVPVNATTSNRLRNPQGIAVHPITKQIFMADTDSHMILKWDMEESQLKIHAGLSSIGWFDNAIDLRDSEFNYPHGISFNMNGSKLYVADTLNHVIREIGERGVRTIAGTGYPGQKVGAALSAAFNNPKHVIADSLETLYVSDTLNHVIKRIKSNLVTILCGSGVPGFKDGRSSIAQMDQPFGLDFDADQNLLIADSNNHAIRLLTIKTGILSTIAGTGQPGLDNGIVNSTFRNPTDVSFDKKDNLIYVCDSGNEAIRVINITNQGITRVSSVSAIMNLRRPSRIAVLDKGELLILDADNNALKLLIKNDLKSQEVTIASNSTSIIIPLLISITIAFCVIMLISWKVVVMKRKSIELKYLASSKSHSVSHSKPTESVGSYLKKMSERERVAVEGTTTLSISRSVAISLPGYLEISNLERKVALEGANENIKSGGTATVVVGALIDPELIEKHQIVNVAVKIVHGNRIKDRDLFESFRYEISIMSALPESPYLVKLVGYSMDPMSIVMKRYAMSLQECLDSRDFFKEEWKQHKAMVEIALGMQIVHSKNIIHFDLKPGNVLIDIKNSASMEFNFLICDFGFADFAVEADKQFVAGMKKPSQQGITPRYAAPEMFLRSIMGSSVISDFKPVDVFAYAMIGYYVLTGTKPWDELFSNDIENRVIKGDRPVIPKKISEANGDLITKCWGQNPRNRLTFDEIVKILK